MDKLTKHMVVASQSNKKHGHTKSVVLIVADDAQRGTYGLCINRPMFMPPCDCGCNAEPAQVFLGGADGLDERFFFLHDQQSLANKKDKLFDGVYLSCPHTADHFTEGKGKMVNGFTHWKPGELQKEIQRGWWFHEPRPDPKLILEREPRRLWRDLTPRHYSLRFSEN